MKIPFKLWTYLNLIIDLDPGKTFIHVETLFVGGGPATLGVFTNYIK